MYTLTELVSIDYDLLLLWYPTSRGYKDTRTNSG